MTIRRKKILFTLICIITLSFRFAGINWDQDQHLHPDERFLTMVTENLKWPYSWHGYLDTNTSLLNPHNTGNAFYVYGTWPIILTKWVSEQLHMADYQGITFVGRALSAITDTITALLVYAIAALAFGAPTSLAAFFFYALFVLPIQLSHFYAVDPYMTCMSTLSFAFLLLLLRYPRYHLPCAIGMGCAWGLAIAAKISALYFAPILGLGLLYALYIHRKMSLFFLSSVGFVISCAFTVRIALPYLFLSPSLFDITLNPKVLDNWRQLESFNDPSGGFPPGVQWITTKAYIFPIKNMLFWGLGFPISIMVFSSLAYMVWQIYKSIRKKTYLNDLCLMPSIMMHLTILWIALLFGYQGRQFVKALRYFLPLYPFFAIAAGYGWTTFNHHLYHYPGLSRRGASMVLAIIMVSIIAYPVSFLSLYTHEHSRVTASKWIYANIPSGSTLSAEHWDDALPLSLPIEGSIHERYTQVEFPLYYPDNQSKWDTMNDALKKTDYIIMSSNRLYGSLMTMPGKFPVTNRYYHMLFDGSLGFEKVAEFTVRPNIPIPYIHWCITPPFARYGIVAKPSQTCPFEGISFVDDYADETFTVYDHPKVSIFKKVKTIDYTRYFYGVQP